MLRKAIIVSALSLLCSSALAANNGFYVGLGTGPEFVNFNKNTTTRQAGNFFVNDNSRLSGMGIFASLFGGYAWVYRAFYLAGEANFDVTNVRSQTSNDEFLHQNLHSAYFRMRRVFGVSLVPGYIYDTNTVFYGRVGYALGYFSLSSSEELQPNMNRNLSGISYGLGVSHAFAHQVGARMEYKQVNYQSAGVTATNGFTTKNTNIAPTTGQVEFALIYYFS